MDLKRLLAGGVLRRLQCESYYASFDVPTLTFTILIPSFDAQ